MPGDIVQAAQRWFPTALGVVLLDLDSNPSPTLLGAALPVALTPHLEIPTGHPLRLLRQTGGDVLLDREAGLPALLAVDDAVLHEIGACLLPNGWLLLRLAASPAQRATAHERLLLQLLGSTSVLLTGLPAPDWRGLLARALLGEHEEAQLIEAALGILASQLPGTTLALWEIESATGRGRALGTGGGWTAPANELDRWHPLEGRLRDAVLLERPLTGHDPARDAWLHAAAPLLMPGDAVLSLWPCGDLTTTRLVLMLGQAAPRPGSGPAALIGEWAAILRTALAQGRALAAMRREAERRARELAIAASIQRSLLPADEELDGWDLAIYHATDSELAGDFVLVDREGPILHLAIGDVAGRGIPASLMMMAAYSLLLARLGPTTELASVLAPWSAELNRLSERNQEGGGDLSYTTLAMVRLDTRTGALTYGKAGHPYPLHFQASTRTVSKWDAMGYPAGLFDEQEFETVARQLDPGDALVLYTDGFSEANIGEGHFGLEGLMRILERFGDFPAPVIKAELLRALAAHLRGQAVGDDTTLAVLTRHRAPYVLREQLQPANFVTELAPPATWIALDPQAGDDVLAGLAALAEALPSWLGSHQPATGGYSVRLSLDASQWHLAIVVPELGQLLRGAEQPAECLALLSDPEHPLRPFAQRMDFVYARLDTGELHGIRAHRVVTHS